MLTDFGYFFIFFVFGYRRKIVLYNLKHSFPDKSNKEIKKLARKYYRHLTDMLAEGVKNLTYKEEQLKKHIFCEDTSIMDRFYKEGKSVLLVSGHYNNWELMITGQNLIFNHQAVGIGMPLSNGFWDKKFTERRSRFGMRVIHAKNVKEKFEEYKNETTATLVLADQSPGDSLKAYWTQFLHRDTAVQFGAEYFAHRYNYPVVFFWLEKVKRGTYKINLDLISEEPRNDPYGMITEEHTRKLEQVINDNPEYWIWTHKRWKRERPNNLEELMEKQKEKFLKKKEEGF